MTYSEIEAFLAVIESGSMTKAAEKLFLSQSTLSSRICILEKELGMSLFKRGKGIRNTELTSQGWDFVAVAEKWKNLWLETEDMKTKESFRVLKTSAIHSINTYIMSEVYVRFTQKYPEIRLRFQTYHSVDSYFLVENGETEAAFITKPQYFKKVDTTPLFREKMVFVCCKDSTYGDTVSPSELDVNNEILLDWQSEFFQWHEYWFGKSIVPKLFTDDMGIMELFLERTDSWAIVPVSAIKTLGNKANIRVCMLEEAPPCRTAYMLTHSLTERSPELIALLSDMEAVLTGRGIEWLLRSGE